MEMKSDSQIETFRVQKKKNQLVDISLCALLNQPKVRIREIVPDRYFFAGLWSILAVCIAKFGPLRQPIRIPFFIAYQFGHTIRFVISCVHLWPLMFSLNTLVYSIAEVVTEKTEPLDSFVFVNRTERYMINYLQTCSFSLLFL